MKLYLFDTINRYKRYSETLDVKTKICNRPWIVFNDGGEKEVYKFKEDGTINIVLSGRVTKGTWEYDPTDKTIIISASDQSYMVHPGMYDDMLLALQVDGTDQCSFLIEENNSKNFAPQTYSELMLFFEEMERARIKAAEEAERKRREEAERKRREEAERKRQQEAERKRREEAERKRQEEAERKRQEEAERRRLDEINQIEPEEKSGFFSYLLHLFKILLWIGSSLCLWGIFVMLTGYFSHNPILMTISCLTMPLWIFVTPYLFYLWNKDK